MSFAELIAQRQSIRAYSPQAVEEESLRLVLEAGCRAPSACNVQPLVFIVCKDAERIKSLASVYSREWFLSAPIVIAVCCDYSLAWKRAYDGKNYGDVDAAIAMDHMILAATELGLGTCWIAAFDPAAARGAFNLPEHIAPVVLTTLGYPAQTPAPRPRKNFAEMVRWGRY
jgi:nitroreductase